MEKKQLKLVPIGIQSFEKIINNNFLKKLGNYKSLVQILWYWCFFSREYGYKITDYLEIDKKNMMN